MGRKIGLFMLCLLWPAGLPLAQTSAGPQTEQDRVENRFRTPRQAVFNFFEWQKPPYNRPEIAAQAFLTNPKLPLDKRIDLAKKLKAILDSKGLFIELDDLPNTPDYADSLTGLHEVILHPQLPQVFLRKQGDQWLFSAETIQAIPTLYRQTVSEVVERTIQGLPAIFKKKIMDVAIWQIIGLFLILLAGGVIRRISEYFMQKIAMRLVRRTKIKWDEKIVEVSSRPISLFLMAGWFLAAYSNLQFGVTVNATIRVFCLILLYFSIIWLLYRLVDLLEAYLTAITSKTESKLDDQLVPLVRKTLKIFIVIIGTIFALQNFDINVTSLLTGLGLGGLAFALAARDTLANFFGSITIFLDKPFQVGDWVVFGGVEGTVEEVGFRSTRIRTFYNSVVSVPNAKVADSAIDNMGLRQYRRIKTYLGLTYSTTPEQMQAFVEGLRAIVQANPHTRKDFYEIHFNNFGSSSLDVLVYVFVKVENWSQELQERHRIMLEILRLAGKIGVEFAFPTQTVHVDSFFSDTPRKVGKELEMEEMAKIVRDFGPGGADSRPQGPRLTYNGKEVTFPAGMKADGGE